MSIPNNLSEIEQQLLMAAAVIGLGPQTDISRANTIRVVNRVLSWRGLGQQQIDAGWRERDCDPTHREVYDALIRMTATEAYSICRLPERPGEALFLGAGNWGVPGNANRPACWPFFNSCRLTIAGEQIARDLLERNE